MKKQLLLLAMVFLPLVANADAVEIDGIYYDLICKGQVAEVTQNPNKYSGYVDIPENVTYNGKVYSVTAIGKNAFYNCIGLDSINIPNSVIIIKEYAFQNCHRLTSITIPNGVTIIERSSFANCSGLTSVTIPKSVTRIELFAFSFCESMTSVNIMDIAAWCSISFGDNPLKYAHNLYLEGKIVNDLVIPDNVECISQSAFHGCRGLTSVTIPNSVTSIEDYAFYECSDLTSVTFGNSVTRIGRGAFADCNSLVSMTIPEGVTSIEPSAFSGCNNLTSVTIPNSVTSIGASAFEHCSILTSVTIPNRVSSIGSRAFYDCSGLTSVNITDIAAWCVISFDFASNPLTYAQHLFLNGVEIKDLVIPDNVISVSDYAFNNCSDLTSVIIGRNVKSIGSFTFARCPELTDVYCYAESVPTTNSNAFENSYIEYATLHVPAESVDAYKTTNPWNCFGTITATDGGQETPQCATPTIRYENGELIFSSETEGVEYISEITDADIKKYYDAKVTLTATYHISVYAIKQGYNNSEVATATLCWIDYDPSSDGLTTNARQIAAIPILVKTSNGFLTVEGLDDETMVSVYTIDGKQTGSATSHNGVANIATIINPGSITIIKIGDRCVKVAIR